MRQPTLFSVFLFISFILVQCTSNERALNKKLNEMASGLNTSTPVMLDQFTRFDKASVTSDNEFQYYYTVLNTENPDSLVATSKKHLEQTIRGQMATHPDLRIFKKNNVVLNYIYRDAQGKDILSIVITPDQYK